MWKKHFLISSVPHEPVLRARWKTQIEKHQPFDDIPIAFPAKKKISLKRNDSHNLSQEVLSKNAIC